MPFTTGIFSNSKGKGKDMEKRRKLEEFYSDASVCLKNMDDNDIPILNKYYPNHHIVDFIEEQKERLDKREYYILVTGN